MSMVRCRCTKVGVPLVSRTCARAVAASRGKARRVIARVLRGSFGAIQEQSVEAKETRLLLPGRPIKASQGTCRDAPRAPARPGERQAPGRDKTTTAARRLPRQATTLCPCSSTSTNVSLWDPSRRTWREAVQPAVRGGKRCLQNCHRGKRWRP